MSRRFVQQKQPIASQLSCSVILIVEHQVFEDEDDDEHEGRVFNFGV